MLSNLNSILFFIQNVSYFNSFDIFVALKKSQQNKKEKIQRKKRRLMTIPLKFNKVFQLYDIAVVFKALLG